MPVESDTSIGGRNERFPVTRDTIVQALREGTTTERERAWEILASIYWKPVYKYIRLKWQRGNEDAKDLTQAFLTAILERDSLAGFDPERARFRTFLRTLLDRFLANQWKAERRQKRGGDLLQYEFGAAEKELEVIRSAETPADEILYQEWVRSVFSRSVDQLCEELEASGKDLHSKIFRAYDLDGSARSYQELATALDLPVTTITNYLSVARRRFREIVLELIRELTASDHEFREEVRALLGVEP